MISFWQHRERVVGLISEYEVEHPLLHIKLTTLVCKHEENYDFYRTKWGDEDADEFLIRKIREDWDQLRASITISEDHREALLKRIDNLWGIVSRRAGELKKSAVGTSTVAMLLVTEPAYMATDAIQAINRAIDVTFSCIEFQHTAYQGRIWLKFKDVEHGTFSRKPIERHIAIHRSEGAAQTAAIVERENKIEHREVKALSIAALEAVERGLLGAWSNLLGK